MAQTMTYAARKEAAREQAIEFQGWLYENNISYEGLVIATEHFEKLGRRYGLTREFRENAII